jgi:hypothetical protein
VQSDNFLLIAMAAAKFGSRPSELVGLLDPVLALDFDLAAAARLLVEERAAATISGADLQPGANAPPRRPGEEFW